MLSDLNGGQGRKRTIDTRIFSPPKSVPYLFIGLWTLALWVLPTVVLVRSAFSSMSVSSIARGGFKALPSKRRTRPKREPGGANDKRMIRRQSASALGIDAAWTLGNASGVALITKKLGRWHLVRVSDSYHSFANADPSKHSVSHRLDVERLLGKCRELLGGDQPQVVAADMPIATRPIVGRRPADDEVSQRFGHAGCSTHSPTRRRPGKVSTDFVRQFDKAGFRCDFGKSVRENNLIEVYPHVALLALASSAFRLPYKALKTKCYWPEESIEKRRKSLLAQWGSILALLRKHIAGIDLVIPPAARSSFSALKPYEDQIDALVCAWVGALYIDGKASALGDDYSAIWIPYATLRR